MRKSFFYENTVSEVKKLQTKDVFTQKGLVERISGIDPSSDALVVRTPIIPVQFRRNGKPWSEASRANYKHGDYIRLKHPETFEECTRSPLIPLNLREQALYSLTQKKEEEIYSLGLSMQPTWGDRTLRLIPFFACAEGLRIFSYGETQTKHIDKNGIEVPGMKVELYADASKVRSDGARAVVYVPSRDVKKQKYSSGINHVPFVRSQENLATALMVSPHVPQFTEDSEPLNSRTLHDIYINLKFGKPEERKKSDSIIFSPQDVSSYIATFRYSWTEFKNLVPLTMNPFAILSRKGAEFYNKINNNVLMFDPTLSSKEKLRHLHLDEKSILIGRAIGKYGHDEIAFWDFERDNALKDYKW